MASEFQRWLQMSGGVLAATLCGTGYAFGLISDPLKDRFDLSQGDLTWISTIGFLAAFFAFPWGWGLDKLGPRPVNAISSCLMSIGFCGYALCFFGAIPATVPTLTACNCLTLFPSAAPDSGGVLPTLTVFPKDQGDVIVVVKTFMGLGSAVFAAVFHAFFDNSTSGEYCLAVAVICLYLGTISTICVGFNLPTPNALPKADKKRMAVAFTLVAVNAILLFAIALLDAYGPSPLSRTATVSILGVAVAALHSFFALPLSYAGSGPAHSTSPEGLPDGDEALLCSEDAHVSNVPNAPVFDTTFAETIVGVLRCTRSGLVYLFLVPVALFVWTTGVVVVVNAAQIYRAANDNTFDAHLNTLHVALIGLGTAGGRVAAGLFPRFVQPQKRVTILIPFFAVLSAVGLALFLVLPVDLYVVPFFVQPFAYGGSWGSALLSFRTLFAKDVGRHYTSLFICGMLALPVLNRGLFGVWFDHEATSQGLAPHCRGKVCFAVPLGLLCALNVVAALSAFASYRVSNRATGNEAHELPRGVPRGTA